jgi:type II secretion system protein G
MKQGFTLIEVLVIIFILGVLMMILIPSLSRAKEQAKIVVVNAELRQIGLALEGYFDDNRKYPPTQADCISGKLTDHLYQLPKALVENGYLPSLPKTDPMSTIMEDRFNRGHTYKYCSVGEIIKDRNIISKYITAKLWIPDRFPASSSINPEEGRFRPDEEEKERYSDDKSLLPSLLPVRWVVFSLGPNFSEQWLNDKLDFENRYPVPKQLWYDSEQRRGFIVRMRLKNGTEIGSFKDNP